MLKDRVAMVTGAAKGLGEAIAIRLAEEGCDMLLVDLDESGLRQTSDRIVALGRRCLFRKVDVTEKSQIDSFVAESVATFKKIDYLVNDAGGSFSLPIGLEETTEADWDWIINANLKGTFFCCQIVAPIMKENRYGSIINMSSRAARQGGPILAYAYVAAKAGIMGLTRKLALDLGPYNIRVNAIAPGIILSGDRMRKVIETRMAGEKRDEYLNSLPLRRFGEPADIAGVAAFLCGDDSSYITGATIDVNGGGAFS
jgi:NAD(P)-dependent dehydrogenase (short-subunit alcohol dehydrogenase family)